MVAIYQNYPINIVCSEFTESMYNWFVERSAKVENKNYNMTRNSYSKYCISLNDAKPVYFFTDGSAKINFVLDDIDNATMFLLQFDTYILKHTLNVETHVEQGVSRKIIG